MVWKLASVFLIALALRALLSECSYEDDFEIKQLAETSCGNFSVNIEKRISGGQQAKDGQFPSYATLLARGNNSIYLCGATIISPRHLLTAAHCTVTVTPDRMFVFPGPERPVIGAEFFRVSKVCRSRRYRVEESGEFHIVNDIAVIKLSTPIKMTQNVQPACLNNKTVPTREQLYSVGLGRENNRNISQRLKYVPTNRYKCQGVHKEASIFCTNSKVGKVCPGDSGGPVYAIRDGRQYLVAVASYALVDCSPDSYEYLAMNANVNTLRNAIGSMMNKCQ